MDFSNYLNRRIDCSCGHSHVCQIDRIIIEEQALNQVPRLITAGGFSRTCLIEDSNTQAAAGNRLKKILQTASIPFHSVTLPAEGLLADEYGIGSIMTYMPRRCDLLIAIGSGTINDLCRFISFKLGIPYIVAGTAPSMDGFTSGVAAMITRQTKTTYETHMPAAFIGDLDILAAAPMDLISAGVGDIIGKYIALTDWKISHIVTGEYFCPEVENLVRQSIEKVRQAVPGLRMRDKNAIASLMDGLVLSGIAMSYIGNSRPASGSEHHLAHYWEMQFLRQGFHGAWHGAKVGVGTIVSLALYRKIQELWEFPPDFNMLRQYQFNQPAWQQKIREAYGPTAQTVIALEEQSLKNSSESVVHRITMLEKHWDEIQRLIAALPTTASIRALLQSLGAPIKPGDIDVDPPMLYNSILYAKDLRSRYGLLQILYDLGIQEESYF